MPPKENPNNSSNRERITDRATNYIKELFRRTPSQTDNKDLNPQSEIIAETQVDSPLVTAQADKQEEPNPIVIEDPGSSELIIETEQPLEEVSLTEGELIAQENERLVKEQVAQFSSDLFAQIKTELGIDLPEAIVAFNHFKSQTDYLIVHDKRSYLPEHLQPYYNGVALSAQRLYPSGKSVFIDCGKHNINIVRRDKKGNSIRIHFPNASRNDYSHIYIEKISISEDEYDRRESTTLLSTFNKGGPYSPPSALTREEKKGGDKLLKIKYNLSDSGGNLISDIPPTLNFTPMTEFTEAMFYVQNPEAWPKELNELEEGEIIFRNDGEFISVERVRNTRPFFISTAPLVKLPKQENLISILEDITQF